MSHKLSLTWERCYWTWKTSAKTVNELEKAEQELVRVFRTLGQGVDIKEIGTYLQVLLYGPHWALTEKSGKSPTNLSRDSVVGWKQQLLQETQVT